MINFNEKYDVVIIGAGHAGCEAALASARLGAKTALYTISIESVAQMSCNPAIGGLAKGNIVKDIDALGGEMARNIDETGIQFRILNVKKGPAVRSSRAQADKALYHERMLEILMSTENLSVKQAVVDRLVVEDGQIKGIVIDNGLFVQAGAVIICTGTFLKGLIHIGDVNYSAGRMNEFASISLTDSLAEIGFKLERLKTGTPARLDVNTIDFSKLEEQPGDENPRPFSFENREVTLPQVSCFITYTNPDTHKIIQDNMHRSPLYSGVIQGVGPRYCPSIEDKVKKFPEKEKHQIFLEPEGLRSKEYYANGFSSSLPIDVQLAMYRSVEGLENVQFVRPAYAIEYDFVQPTVLTPELETKTVSNLYFAGQINGTSGYEEAAAQGLIAGINAVRKLGGQSPLNISRGESYIGVMIDDLITKGVDEPYRMFSSRAEYRLWLREDNAEDRLLKAGYDCGLIKKDRYDRYLQQEEEIDKEIERLKNFKFKPNEETQKFLSEYGVSIKNGISAYELMKRPELSYGKLSPVSGQISDSLLAEKIEIKIKYEGYLKKQAEEIDRFKKIEEVIIPSDLNLDEVQGLRREYIDKLRAIKPKTLGQASRIQGMTPAAISLLHIYIRKHNGKN